MCTPSHVCVYVCTQRIAEILTYRVISDKGIIIRVVPLPAVCCSERELEYRLNAGKAPHATADKVRQVVGVLDVVLLLVGDQEFRKAPVPER